MSTGKIHDVFAFFIAVFLVIAPAFDAEMLLTILHSDIEQKLSNGSTESGGAVQLSDSSLLHHQSATQHQGDQSAETQHTDRRRFGNHGHNTGGQQVGCIQ